MIRQISIYFLPFNTVESEIAVHSPGKAIHF